MRHGNNLQKMMDGDSKRRCGITTLKMNLSLLSTLKGDYKILGTFEYFINLMPKEEEYPTLYLTNTDLRNV